MGGDGRTNAELCTKAGDGACSQAGCCVCAGTEEALTEMFPILPIASQDEEAKLQGRVLPGTFWQRSTGTANSSCFTCHIWQKAKQLFLLLFQAFFFLLTSEKNKPYAKENHMDLKHMRNWITAARHNNSTKIIGGQDFPAGCCGN